MSPDRNDHEERVPGRYYSLVLHPGVDPSYDRKEWTRQAVYSKLLEHENDLKALLLHSAMGENPRLRADDNLVRSRLNDTLHTLAIAFCGREEFAIMTQVNMSIQAGLGSLMERIFVLSTDALSKTTTRKEWMRPLSVKLYYYMKPSDRRIALTMLLYDPYASKLLPQNRLG